MGYNGGINKRGYYRRNNGMYSKSSWKSGSKILTNSLLGGLGLLSILGDSISDLANDTHTNYTNNTAKHFSPLKQRKKYIICTILSILCPISGCLTYIFADWFMLFSILVFGIIELFICGIFLLITEKKQESNLDSYYIYEDEIDIISQKCKINLNIFKIQSIILFILNLYPIILLILHECGIWWGWEDDGITMFLWNLKFLWNFTYSYIAIAADTKRTAETYDKIIKNNTHPQKTKTSSNIAQIKENEINSQIIQYTQNKITPQTAIKLPKINGEYVEEFKSPYGKLHIKEKSASIQFYFPGIDARYNGTFFSISETDIDKYIKAYTSNWKIAEELQNKAQEIPNTEIKQSGAMNMNIIVTNKEITLFLHKYHLPIRTKAECEEIINLFLTAKLRIKEIQNKLFT